jgi:phage-related protein/predicted XRE-type DNA-binding protein
MGSSRKDLRAFPRQVRADIGKALYAAQMGDNDPAAKPLKGFGGAGVMEIVDRHDTNTYRAVYTVQFAGVVYALHAFQKKSKRGIATPPRISNSSAAGWRMPGGSTTKGRTEMATKKKNTISYEKSSGNVFADLGLPNPEQELLKARLALQIYRIIKARKFTQAQAGTIIGIAQPQVSLLMRNRSGNFSVERLMTFLTALGQDVEITVRSTRKEHGAMSVTLV